MRIPTLPLWIDSFSNTHSISPFCPEGSVAYHCLTHFHTDHTKGLHPSWSDGLIFCSEVTRAMLVEEFCCPHDDAEENYEEESNNARRTMSANVKKYKGMNVNMSNYDYFGKQRGRRCAFQPWRVVALPLNVTVRVPIIAQQYQKRDDQELQRETDVVVPRSSNSNPAFARGNKTLTEKLCERRWITENHFDVDNHEGGNQRIFLFNDDNGSETEHAVDRGNDDEDRSERSKIGARFALPRQDQLCSMDDILAYQCIKSLTTVVKPTSPRKTASQRLDGDSSLLLAPSYFEITLIPTPHIPGSVMVAVDLRTPLSSSSCNSSFPPIDFSATGEKVQTNILGDEDDEEVEIEIEAGSNKQRQLLLQQELDEVKDNHQHRYSNGSSGGGSGDDIFPEDQFVREINEGTIEFEDEDDETVEYERAILMQDQRQRDDECCGIEPTTPVIVDDDDAVTDDCELLMQLQTLGCNKCGTENGNDEDNINDAESTTGENRSQEQNRTRRSPSCSSSPYLFPVRRILYTGDFRIDGVALRILSGACSSSSSTSATFLEHLLSFLKATRKPVDILYMDTTWLHLQSRKQNEKKPPSQQHQHQQAVREKERRSNLLTCVEASKVLTTIYCHIQAVVNQRWHSNDQKVAPSSSSSSFKPPYVLNVYLQSHFGKELLLQPLARQLKTTIGVDRRRWKLLTSIAAIQQKEKLRRARDAATTNHSTSAATDDIGNHRSFPPTHCCYSWDNEVDLDVFYNTESLSSVLTSTAVSVKPFPCIFVVSRKEEVDARVLSLRSSQAGGVPYFGLYLTGWSSFVSSAKANRLNSIHNTNDNNHNNNNNKSNATLLSMLMSSRSCRRMNGDCAYGEDDNLGDDVDNGATKRQQGNDQQTWSIDLQQHLHPPTIWSVPFSLHASPEDLEAFVAALKPRAVFPLVTTNSGCGQHNNQKNHSSVPSGAAMANDRSSKQFYMSTQSSFLAQRQQEQDGGGSSLSSLSSSSSFHHHTMTPSMIIKTRTQYCMEKSLYPLLRKAGTNLTIGFLGSSHNEAAAYFPTSGDWTKQLVLYDPSGLQRAALMQNKNKNNNLNNNNNSRHQGCENEASELSLSELLEGSTYNNNNDNNNNNNNNSRCDSVDEVNFESRANLQLRRQQRIAVLHQQQEEETRGKSSLNSFLNGSDFAQRDHAMYEESTFGRRVLEVRRRTLRSRGLIPTTEARAADHNAGVIRCRSASPSDSDTSSSHSSFEFSDRNKNNLQKGKPTNCADRKNNKNNKKSQDSESQTRNVLTASLDALIELDCD